MGGEYATGLNERCAFTGRRFAGQESPVACLCVA